MAADKKKKTFSLDNNPALQYITGAPLPVESAADSADSDADDHAAPEAAANADAQSKPDAANADAAGIDAESEYAPRRGMLPRSKRVQLLITADSFERVAALAAIEGVSKNELINRAIEEFLAKK